MPVNSIFVLIALDGKPTLNRSLELLSHQQKNFNLAAILRLISIK